MEIASGESGLADAGTRRLGSIDGPELVASRIGVTPPPLVTVDAGASDVSSSALRLEATHLEALAGGGAATPSAPGVISPVLSLELALTFNARVRLGVLGAFDFGGTTTVLDERGQTRGALTTRGGLVGSTLTVCANLPVRLCGGALLGSRITEGAASGTFIFGSRVSRVAAFLVGPTVQATLLFGRFHLALDATLVVTPQPPDFFVFGLPTRVTLPVAQGLFRLSVGVGSL